MKNLEIAATNDEKFVSVGAASPTTGQVSGNYSVDLGAIVFNDVPDADVAPPPPAQMPNIDEGVEDGNDTVHRETFNAIFIGSEDSRDGIDMDEF